MTKYGIGKLDFWFKVDYCFPIMSYDGIVYPLLFRQWLMPSNLFNYA